MNEYSDPEDFFNEYGDPDATSCSLGDYNAFEENQVFLDDESDYETYDNCDLD